VKISQEMFSNFRKQNSITFVFLSGNKQNMFLFVHVLAACDTMDQQSENAISFGLKPVKSTVQVQLTPQWNGLWL